MNAEDLQSPRQPLHLFDETLVSRVGTYLLFGPVREWMRARAHERQIPAFEMGLKLGEGGFEVGARLGHVRADAGDDLDGRLEQLVLGLGVGALGMGTAGVGQDLGGPAVQLASVDVDDLELHLDTETRALRGVEVDLHQFSPRGSLVLRGVPAVGPQVLLGVGANPTWGSLMTSRTRVFASVRVAALRAVPQAQRFLLRQVVPGHDARIDWEQRCSA